MEERQRWCDRTQWIYLYFHSNVTMGEIPSSCEAVKAGTAGSLLGGPGCCQAAFLVRYIWEYTMPQQVHAIRGGISEIAGGCQFFSKWCCPVFFFPLSNCVQIYSKMYHLYRNIFKGPVIFTLLLLFVARRGAEGKSNGQQGWNFFHWRKVMSSNEQASFRKLSTMKTEGRFHPGWNLTKLQWLLSLEILSLL